MHNKFKDILLENQKIKNLLRISIGKFRFGIVEINYQKRLELFLFLISIIVEQLFKEIVLELANRNLHIVEEGIGIIFGLEKLEQKKEN